jgi:DWNN domain
MSSTILYKFRSGTTFEALPLPGSAARLFDVKKAIVVAKKLDAGTMDFDLSVRNASNNEEYTDESMLLPRGTRLVVQRLPAAKGQGFLARMARNQYGMAGQAATPAGGAPSGFYEIDSRARDDDEEFVSAAADEDQELAALKAVTDMSSSTASAVRPAVGNNFGRGGPAGQGPPPQHHQHHGHGGSGQQRPQKQRQNADPELREQEKKLMGRKRATGIPRTFLNLSAPPTTEAKEGGEGEENNAPLLQPNTLGFEELKTRGGGQSENATGTKKDLEYALKVTATTIPDYLQCAICHSVALTAMFLTWDPEGRTTCDKCIRDALTENGFRDPLTGMEGISPDDLRPNPGIRKAAEAFVKEVMDKIEEIEKQQVDEEPTDEGAHTSKTGNLLAGDSAGDKGVIITKRNSITKRKNKDDDDPFGGEDDFGGDVFAVTADEKPEEDIFGTGGTEEAKDNGTKEADRAKGAEAHTEQAQNEDSAGKSNDDAGKATNTSLSYKDPALNRQTLESKPSFDPKDQATSPTPSRTESDRNDNNRRDFSRQRRGPPAGYQMGPAGGATNPHAGPTPHAGPGKYDRSRSDDYNSHGHGVGRGQVSPTNSGGRFGGRFQDRGGSSSYRGRGVGRGGGRGRFGGRYNDQGRGDRENHGIRSHSPSRGHDDVSTVACMHWPGDSFCLFASLVAALGTPGSFSHQSKSAPLKGF